MGPWMVTSQWAADIQIVMAGLRFILRALPWFLRVLPLVFWPLQPIDFTGYSARLICGVGLCYISALSQTASPFLRLVVIAVDRSIDFVTREVL